MHYQLDSGSPNNDAVPAFHWERQVAELAVQRAAVLTKKLQSSISEHGADVNKSDSTPVTVADFAVQALLITAMHSAFPDDAFLGEENADALREDKDILARVWGLCSTQHSEDARDAGLQAVPSSMDEMLSMLDLGGRGTGGATGRFWVMDPIDGTATFLKGGHYAVSLALIQDGREVVGVLGCPNLSVEASRVVETDVDHDGFGTMFSAVIGQGAVKRAIREGPLLPASPIIPMKEGPRDLKDLHFVDSRQSKAWDFETATQVAAAFGAVYPSTDVFSSHMRYAALIAGGGDVQLRIPKDRQQAVYVWDHAGSQLIFKEVGGKITDLKGQNIDFCAGRTLSKNWGLIMANSGVHEVLLRKVRGMICLDKED
ncbi:hypothetical protein N0V93_010267 [Gnomoniopsis smithogilvyi]|uniref:3'(2'),5'-bisphosphate nucleotidase n=1 Tax=Gnomoniopsis smithogilvyi TaxID=1191159 RepID=A0A9W8YHV0_9PEZI|nr:hypothetical protein N0V93_010267 [Gnomoniopsis smithogilvyi]